MSERSDEPDSQGDAGSLPDSEESPRETPPLAKIEPAQITAAIERMAPPVREIFEMAVSTMVAPHNPLIDKFNDEHVKQFLDNDKIETENEYKLRSSNRLYHLGYVVISLLALGWLIWFLLPHNKDLLADLLKIVLAFGGGVTSGFGLKAQLDKKKTD